ncbi:hypothetical protein DL93DRAFT_2071456 [Clavulina sp. PMI_390]|nr:hypothetical protein DL93DRAFT_2071456 [Clavulina sp. PMI_390]
MWARVLLVWHAFRYGRLKQALRLSNSNVSLALSANLHHMPHHNEYGQQREYGLLPPLSTQMHSIERSHLWWAIYLTDIQVSLNLGLMPNNYLDSLKPDSITTPLPIPFRMPIPEKLEDPTSLFAKDYQHVENDTVCGLRVKSTLLCAFAADVSRVLIYPDAPEEFWKKHRMGAAALAGFVKVLPPLNDMRDMDPGYPGAVSPGMLRVHTTALLGTYFVTGVHTLDEAAARKKRVEFALQIADVAKQLEDVAMIYPQVPIGLTWSLAADILVEELLDDERSPHSDDIEDIRNHLRIYADRLGQLQGFFTGLKPFLRYINEDLLNPNSSLDLISLRKRRPDSQVSPFILDGRV